MNLTLIFSHQQIRVQALAVNPLLSCKSWVPFLRPNYYYYDYTKQIYCAHHLLVIQDVEDQEVASPTAPSTSAPPTKKRNRPAHNISIACSFCREKRSKCSGEHPCSNCAKRNLQCVYPETSRRKRQKTSEHPNALATAVNQALVLAMPMGQNETPSDNSKFLAGQIDYWRELYLQQKIMSDILWQRSYAGDMSLVSENEVVTKYQRTTQAHFVSSYPNNAICSVAFLKFVLPMSTNFNFSRVFGPLRNTNVHLNSSLTTTTTQVEEFCDILDWHVVMSTGALLCGQLQASRPFIEKSQEVAKILLLETAPSLRAPYVRWHSLE